MRTTKIIEAVKHEGQLEFADALYLAEEAGKSDATLESLLLTADELRQKHHGNSFDLCSIINARSGKCSENCKFCAQSAHYDVEVETYNLVDAEKAVSLARENQEYGVERFSLVTAGHHVSEEDLQKQFAPIYKQLQRRTSMLLCASMGFLTPERACRLRAMGVTRYHCNLEASRSYFPTICTTHTWEQKVETLKLAQEAGLELCSGGIFGLGESLRQRLELAFELRELGVASVPLNILMPIKNTPFETVPSLSSRDVLLSVAMFRLILPRAVIRIAGGRNHLGNEQERFFTSGANGAIVGNYLTTSGKGLAGDISMFRRLGFTLKEPL